jgi:hypothetical protein
LSAHHYRARGVFDFTRDFTECLTENRHADCNNKKQLPSVHFTPPFKIWKAYQIDAKKTSPCGLSRRRLPSRYRLRETIQNLWSNGATFAFDFDANKQFFMPKHHVLQVRHAVE